MNYRSLAPDLKVSCYNCAYFRVSGDMMNGSCRYGGGMKADIGIGTCNYFTAKSGEHFTWSQLRSEAESDTNIPTAEVA